MSLLLVAVGGAAGAAARYAASSRWDRPAPRLPSGTIAVNVLGSLILGVLIGAGAGATGLALLGVGFCGALTTYSAFAVQVTERAGPGARRGAGLVTALTLVPALLAVLVGAAVGGLLA
ncbi:CrcB family protein [Nocardioides sp.]|uniref:fluoride efflux transporter FluC n=1 Tax=Nocardioides sp. TaxID=35761 RepID=UPI0027365CB9|nr:CrcB family protein [Nocardioides sp.]MDP3890455.1 CrcB family protein [Nocardioides sp.]